MGLTGVSWSVSRLCTTGPAPSPGTGKGSNNSITTTIIIIIMPNAELSFWVGPFIVPIVQMIGQTPPVSDPSKATQLAKGSEPTQTHLPSSGVQACHPCPVLLLENRCLQNNNFVFTKSQASHMYQLT